MRWIALMGCCFGLPSLFSTEIRVDYLLWTVKENPVPTPFVTTVSYDDPLPGALGQPGSHIKMGHTHFDMGWQNGFQIAANTWIGRESRFGIEGSYFLLPKATQKKALNTSGQVGAPAYAVPISDVTGFWGLDGVAGESIYLLPGPLLGTSPGFQAQFQLKVASTLQGAQLNGLYHWKHIDFMGGFRWVSLQESLRFSVQSKSVPGFPGSASFFNSRDRFSTSNNFFGPQIGLQARLDKNRWHLNGVIMGGIGAMLEHARVQGTSISPGGNLFYEVLGGIPRKIAGGIFAQPTNIGSYSQTRFAGLLETAVRASFAFHRYFELNAGYDFLWMSSVARPGGQIDRKINPTLTGLGAASRATAGTRTDPTPFGMPGPAQPPQGPKKPHFDFKRSDFWAQGFSFGLGARF